MMDYKTLKKLKELEDRNKVLQEMDYKMRVDQEAQRIADAFQKASPATKMQQVQDFMADGLITVDQARRLLGFPNIEGYTVVDIETRQRVMRTKGRDLIIWEE